MKRAAPIQANSIAENCRSILRERYCDPTGRLGTFTKQGCPPNTWKPCHSIPTNPIHSIYGIDNLRVPIVHCEEPSYCNSLFGLSPTIPSNNYIRRPTCLNWKIGPIKPVGNQYTNCVPCISTPSENCIQMITNAIITRIRCKIPQEEVALLCCCLPSLIRQMMCKSPWLTPNDIIQCLSADIIKEAAHCFDQVDLNVKNDVHKPKQDHLSRERLPQPRRDNTMEDHRSTQSHEDENDSLSSDQHTTSATSQHPSKSVLDVPIKDDNKQRHEERENNSRTPSTRSFTSQRSKNLTSDSHHSLASPSWSTDNQSKPSDHNTPVQLEEDARSFTSNDKDSDRKSTDLSAKSESMHPSSRIHIDYPGKKDPNVIRDVEKCLAFYEKIREYFDDDAAAMLLKCCLCYGDCSGKK